MFKKAITQNEKPSLVNIDQSGANTAGLTAQLMRPLLGCKNLYAAQWTLAGMEVRATIKKGQMKIFVGDRKTPAEIFYALAA